MTLQTLFKKPGSWTQGALARTRKRNVVSPHSTAAVCYCLEGALVRCYPEHAERVSARQMLIAAIRKLFGTPNYVNWNDESGRRIRQIRRAVKEANI